MPLIIKILILALLQGITEFLPVSSSGHLVLGGVVLGINTPGALLEIALHAGTLISIILFFRVPLLDLVRRAARNDANGRLYVAAIITGSIPAGVLYVGAGDYMEALFDQPTVAAAALCVTGLMLLTLLACKQDNGHITLYRAFGVGLAQAAAMIPGISRSGATIVAGRHLGLSRKEAAEFSFFMAIPILSAATMFKIRDIVTMGEASDTTVPLLLAGVIVAAGVGYVALGILMRVLTAGRFWAFGIYCLLAGIIALLAGV